MFNPFPQYFYFLRKLIQCYLVSHLKMAESLNELFFTYLEGFNIRGVHRAANI